MLRQILKESSLKINHHKKILVKELYPKHVITGVKKKSKLQSFILNSGHQLKKTIKIPSEYLSKKKLLGFSVFINDYIFQSIKNKKCRFYAPIAGGSSDAGVSLLDKFSFFVDARRSKMLFVRVAAVVKKGLLLYSPHGFVFFISYRKYFKNFFKMLYLQGFKKIFFNKYSFNWFLIESSALCARIKKLNSAQAKSKKKKTKERVFNIAVNF